MRRATAVLLLAGSLVGCASHSVSESPWLVQRDTSAPKRCEPLTADQELVLGLSQEMGSAGRWHAALANLERLPEDVPQVRLSKARLLRLLGHSNDAETLYGSLLSSCLVADANHGLGQIEAARGRYTEAQNYLRTAASLSPANEAIRNDLGVAYMNQRRLSEARFELLTAMELGENSRRAALNMLTLLVYQGNWQAAQELVSAKGLSSADFKLAEQRARNMRNQDANAPMTAAATPAPVPAVVGRPLATAEPAGTAAAVASLATPVASAPRVGAADVVPAATPRVGAEAAVSAAAPAPVTAPAPVRASATAPAAKAPSVRAAAPAFAPTPTPGALRTPSRRGAPPTCDGTPSAQTQDSCRRATPARRWPSGQPTAASETPTPVRAFAAAPADAAPSAGATGLPPTPVRAFAAAPVEAAPRTEATAAVSTTAPAPAPIRDFVAAPAAAGTPMSLSAAVRAWAVENAASVDSAANQVRDVQQAPSAGARPIVCRSSASNTPGLAVMECLPE